MSRAETIVTVFVASPSDVTEERAVLEDVIRNHNDTWARTLGVRFELIKWETHTHPGVGIDAQAVINAQLPTDYDVFIGILWTRLGTPTSRASSGTAEEFEQAMTRHANGSMPVEIMLYFKTGPIDPEDVIPDQLAGVKTFRQAAGDHGVFFRTFRTPEDFQSLVRDHLARIAQDHGKQAQSMKPSELSPHHEATSLLATPADESIEDLGLFDLVELGAQEMTTANASLGRLASFTTDFGVAIARRADAINVSASSRNPQHLNILKQQANAAADDMGRYVAIASAEVPIFSDAQRAAMNRVVDLAAVALDFGIEGRTAVRKLVDQVSQIAVSMEQAREHVLSFRASVAKMPRLTGRVIVARRSLLALHDSIAKEIAGLIVVARDVVSIATTTLGEDVESSQSSLSNRTDR